MTIFDMLELLETEIVSLRAQNQELRMSLDRRREMSGVESQRPKARKRTGAAKKKTKRKRSGSLGKTKANGLDVANVKGEQTELPVAAAAGEPKQESRSLGKRQALGKSLLQLRKTAAPRDL